MEKAAFLLLLICFHVSKGCFTNLARRYRRLISCLIFINTATASGNANFSSQYKIFKGKVELRSLYLKVILCVCSGQLKADKGREGRQLSPGFQAPTINPLSACHNEITKEWGPCTSQPYYLSFYQKCFITQLDKGVI